MKSDLKQRLFSSVILSSKPDPVYLGGRRRPRLSSGAILWAALVITATAGLLMLLAQKIAPIL